MEPYNVIKAERSDNGIVTHVVATKDGEKIVRYHDIRAGLSWPTETAPGYYCILGEEFQDAHKFEGAKRRGELQLLAEYEFNGISLNDLFARLTDDTAMLECRSIYTDMEDPFVGHVESYWGYSYENGVRMGSLGQAPYVDNFLLGVSWIQDWVKSNQLEIPDKSVIYSQLKQITKADLAESPESRFYAINALRFVVGAFRKYRPSHSHFSPNRRKNLAPFHRRF